MSLRFAFQSDAKVIGEAAVTGREIELAVLGSSPAAISVAGEIIIEHADGFYSYDAKYIDEHGARLERPARLSADESARAQALALRAFEVLECEGMARVDVFLRSDGELLDQRDQHHSRIHGDFYVSKALGVVGRVAHRVGHSPDRDRLRARPPPRCNPSVVGLTVRCDELRAGSRSTIYKWTAERTFPPPVR